MSSSCLSVRISEFCLFFFFFQAEDGIRDLTVTGVQTCALPIYEERRFATRIVLLVEVQRAPCGDRRGTQPREAPLMGIERAEHAYAAIVSALVWADAGIGAMHPRGIGDIHQLYGRQMPLRVVVAYMARIDATRNGLRQVHRS